MKLSMSLREKIGQTGIAGPAYVRDAVVRCGSYEKYFEEHPFGGIHAAILKRPSGEPFDSPEEQAQLLKKLSEQAKVPYFVTCDFEFGAKDMFSNLHSIPTNMSLAASGSEELAYKRGYYYAKELKQGGINWVFGPVFDRQNNFLNPSGVRCLSDNAQTIIKYIPSMVKGVQDGGIAATAKHFPGAGNGYRDAHFCSLSGSEGNFEEWMSQEGKIWKKAAESGVKTFMIGHEPFTQVDPSCARGRIPRPATASKKVIEFLRNEIGFDGLVVTDAVGMRSLASAFDHDDTYIECFNAGCDVILFVHDDYIDVMEKAVLDGRVSEKRLDEAVERILKLKEELGLLEGVTLEVPLTPEENEDFEKINYEIAKKALTTVANVEHILPFDREKIKKAAIITLAPYEPFMENLKTMVARFEEKGIQVTVFRRVETKRQMEEIANEYDLIVYACYLAQGRPQGMSFYSAHNDIISLLHVFCYGAEKSVGVSFGAPSIFYNYFENVDAFINAYSCDDATMKAVVDGILGEFEFTGKSPVALRP